MSTIWVDVTTILSWQRPAVGVVRVEAECAAHALQQSSEKIKFCRFGAGGYDEVDRLVVRDALYRIHGKSASKQKVQQLEAPSVQEHTVVTFEQRFKSMVLRLIDMLPAKQRQKAFNFAIRRAEPFTAVLRSSQEFGHALKIFFCPPKSGFSVFPSSNQQLESITTKDAVPFNSTDVYISLGLDWDKKDLVYLYELKRKNGFKVLLFCYDLIPVKFPHLCVGDVAASFARYFTDVAWCADEILCISECSKRDLHELLTDLGAPIPSLSVIRLGCELPNTITTDVIAPDVAETLSQRYILYVSTIERRKNHETIYRAYTRLIDQGENNLPLLVFVGMPGWGVNDFMADLQFDYRIKNLIKVMSHVTDADLAKLYQNALFTVYPSLYEGWGLPVAESLSAGKFCLASNAASIPEVGGDLVEYLNPLDVTTWSERLKWYFAHPEEVFARQERISSQYMPTPWSQTAGQVYAHAISLSSKK